MATAKGWLVSLFTFSCYKISICPFISRERQNRRNFRAILSGRNKMRSVLILSLLIARFDPALFTLDLFVSLEINICFFFFHFFSNVLVSLTCSFQPIFVFFQQPNHSDLQKNANRTENDKLISSTSIEPCTGNSFKAPIFSPRLSAFLRHASLTSTLVPPAQTEQDDWGIDSRHAAYRKSYCWGH